jgi:hypothetical protein
MSRYQFNGAIALLFGDDGMRLELRDESSRQTFLYVHVPEDQVSKMLSRLASIPCRFGLHAPERVGLIHEHKSFAFPIPKSDFKTRREIAIQAGESLCPEGWVMDRDFSSQNSFFALNGEEMARTTIRRYVAPQPSPTKLEHSEGIL